MKKYLVFLIVFMFVFANCSKDDEEQIIEEIVPVLVGQDGNPRFNLMFTNPDNVDLDLYVKTPSGAIIYYGNLTADENGSATISMETDEWCIGCGDPNKDILGKAIIVHQAVDDFVTQPTGNAGGRVSCGGIIE